MHKHFRSRHTRLTSLVLKKLDRLWFRAMLVIITATALGAVVLPVAAMLLSGESSDPEYQAFSHVIRSSAFVAYILIWASMLAGLSITSKLARKGPGMSASYGVHRYTTLLGLGFAVLHALALLGDKYMGYTLGGLLVPFMERSYKPHWVGLGQIALYAFAVIAFSFYVRNRLGVRAWRLIHSLSFALFLMVLIHGLQAGSDSSYWWARTLYWVSAASILLGAIYRVLAMRVGRSKERALATGLIAVGGKTQARRDSRVLQAKEAA